MTPDVVLTDKETIVPEHAAKPCPFCGFQPAIRPWHGVGPRKRTVCCVNGGCWVMPEVTGASQKSALSHWNVRVQS